MNDYQLTKKEALRLGESKVWEKWDDNRIVAFQLFQDKLCMDFSRFHKAVGAVLGRPVFTHEFAGVEVLREEFLGQREKPSLEEILSIIPEAKRLTILSPDTTEE